jgi:putative endonuclease
LKANARGQAWEELAERYLQAHGLVPLKRNFHCRLGEVDLIMRDGDTTVFVEVRYRRGNSHGSAIESVTRPKQLKLIRAAGIFLSRRPSLAHGPCRFDVVGISGTRKQPDIQWVSDAFGAY